MPKALFVVPIDIPLPDLQYPRPGGPTHVDGGYSVVGRIPQRNTCIVEVDASAETIAALKADPRFLSIPSVLDKAPDVAYVAKAKAYLVSKGATTSTANTLDKPTGKGVVEALRVYHGVALNEGVTDETYDTKFLVDYAGNQLIDGAGNEVTV
jgi:hypothetical protein